MRERKITKIERKKGLYFVHMGDEVVSLSETFYLDEHLYASKEIKDDELRKLRYLSELSEPYEYACRLLSRNAYSSYLLKEKVKAKYPSFKYLDDIVKRLTDSSLLNDWEYAENFKEMKEAALIGPNKIKNDLLYIKKVNPDIVSSLSFSPEEEAIAELIPIMERRYQAYPYKAKIRKIETALIARGFNKELAHKYSLTIDKDEKEEKALLKKDYDKAKRIQGRKCQGYELKQRIIRSLLYKGYKMNDIEELMRND